MENFGVCVGRLLNCELRMEQLQGTYSHGNSHYNACRVVGLRGEPDILDNGVTSMNISQRSSKHLRGPNLYTPFLSPTMATSTTTGYPKYQASPTFADQHARAALLKFPPTAPSSVRTLKMPDSDSDSDSDNELSPEYWQFIRLISPTPNPPPGTPATYAAGVWCMKCHEGLEFTNKDIRVVKHHMQEKHADELAAFKAVKAAYKAVYGEDSDDAASTAASPRAAPAQHRLTSTMSTKRSRTQDPTPTKASKCLRTQRQLWVGDAPGDTVPVDNSSWLTPFPDNPFWSDLHEETKPVQPNVYKAMTSEMVWALPPCDGRRVVDVCAGTGRAAAAVVAAYNTAEIEMVDKSAYHLELASKQVAHLKPTKRPITTTLDLKLNADDPLIPGNKAHVVVGCLAFSILAEQSVEQRVVETLADAHALLFRQTMKSLESGGYLVIGDEESHCMSTHAVARALETAGYTEVKIVWCRDGFFVIGGRKPISVAA